MKSYVVLLAAWMAAFAAAGVRSAGADSQAIVLANLPSSSGLDPALLQPQPPPERHRASTPSPAIIHGPSYLSALRDYDLLAPRHRLSYSPSAGFKLNDRGD
ncbi:hypothetical protein [Paraburkholderia diazotrophica]|uniref:Uncharacterized protein n=1 Tax=Paraburkholderia diazotrophica TaxID=667676 RepID=A0A1H7C903_9BURK|nr:hypothetical protein [Paraburkholderia diazotrophica]SEJ82125.1 hypothetical protein SAMN05192539_101991 [Paraburkholderia diazotrophica]